MRITDEIKIKKIVKIIKKGLQKKNVCRRLEEWTEADTPASRPRGWGVAEAKAEASEPEGEEPGAKAKGERSSGAESPSRD